MSNEISINENEINDLYSSVSLIITDARNKVYSAANSAMVTAYRNIGRIIYEQEQKGKDRAEYQFTLPTAEELQNYIEQERRRFEERSDIL